MKHNILGFNQLKLVEFNIDLDEALILRYFIDFKDTGKMVKEIIGEETYYWINYNSIKEALPILNVSKDRVYRKLKNLVTVGLLKHTTVKNNGTYSYYAVGDKYIELIQEDTKENLEDSKNNEANTKEGTVKITNGMVKTPRGSVKIPKGYGENNGGGTVKTPEGYGKNTRPKDYSIKDTSIKYNSSIKDIYIGIIDYLNLKCSTSYKPNTKKTQQLILARLKEGFTVEDFKKVIDKKSKEWKETDFAKYLRPETLFGTKFEGYLNQTAGNKANYNQKQDAFNNYEQRDYDFESLEKKLLGWSE